MDILLTHGYFLYDDPHELKVMKPYPPLGILHLSSYLKQRGFDVGVYDATFGSMAGYQQILETERPSVVGLYTNLMTKHNILRMAAMAKAANAWVILGGPDPPYHADEYLQHDADIIVRGEGELTLAELLPQLAGRGRQGLTAIEGITYLDDEQQLVETPARPLIRNLSDLPWADREAIDIERYMHVWKTHHGQSSISVIHARGCAYSCEWCSHSVYGTSHRRRTPQDAADELLWIKERYNPDLIWYADDVFAINHRWLFAYHEALKAHGVRIPFECISRADRLNERVIDTLSEMGCYRLWNGSESGSQAVLDAMNRKVKVEDVQAKTHMLQSAGIETGMFIMLGYDGETVEDIEQTVEHLKICNPDIFLTTVAYPIKGTPYYTRVESDILADSAWEQHSDRDLTVAGRYSKQFYGFATRWMVSEVALNRLQKGDGGSYLRRLKLRTNILLGRIGMRLTQHQRETRGTRIHSSHA